MSDQTKQPDLAAALVDAMHGHLNDSRDIDLYDRIQETLRSDPTLKAVEEALENCAKLESKHSEHRPASVALTALRQLRGEEG